ncbi:MAG: hypothetical protein EBU93_06885, partial [Chlamydiae bacterium]|nr:hypothetical protein [Chlamydiota bacterium]
LRSEVPLSEDEAKELIQKINLEGSFKELIVKGYDSVTQSYRIQKGDQELDSQNLQNQQNAKIFLLPQLEVFEPVLTRNPLNLFWTKVESYGWFNILQILPPVWILDLVYLIYCCLVEPTDFIPEGDKSIIKNLLSEQAPLGFDGIKTILKVTKDVLKEKVEENHSMIKKLEDALTLNELYADPAGFEAFKEQLQDNLYNSSLEKPVFFMTGYYQQKLFLNSALTIYKTEQNKVVLRISQMQATKEINGKVNPDTQCVFDNQEDLFRVLRFMHAMNRPVSEEKAYSEYQIQLINK